MSIPAGGDRADGTDGLPGTPTPETAQIFQPVTANPSAGGGWFEESKTSPTIERGEQGTVSHDYNLDWTNALELIAGIGRGDVLTDNEGNNYRVVSSRVQYQANQKAIANITSEGLGTWAVPPDEFRVEVVEFNPSIFLHPRYATVVNYNLDSSGNIINTALWTGPQIIQAINQQAELAQQQSQNEQAALLNSTNIANSSVLTLALELVTKIRRGEDTFYIAGFRVVYSTYYFQSTLLNPGGYIEDPVAANVLPAYFWSDDGTPTGNNIFTTLAAAINPALYANGLSWLRYGDDLDYQRTWFKLTSSWVAGGAGQWDEDLYGFG